MKVRTLRRLSRKQKEEIRALEELCRRVDKTKATAYLKNDYNMDVSIPCFYLGYEEDMLVCFLIFYFIEPGYAEAGCFVHPEKRRQGYFTAAFLKAKEKLLEAGITGIRFTHEPESGAVLPVLAALGAEKESSEYLLCYERKEEVFIADEGLTLKHAGMKDIDDILRLHLKLFEMKETDVFLLLKGCVMGKHAALYKLLKEDVLVGFCCIAMDGGCCTIFSFGIAEAYQGMGLGRQMLHLLMEDLSGTERVLLHVSSRNVAAYGLYMGFGFKIREQFDYYMLRI